MRRSNGSLATVLLLIGFALGIVASASSSESHPNIHQAQKLLTQAKTALEHAAHDYAGHRVKAIDHISAAQEELRLALESDHK